MFKWFKEIEKIKKELEDLDSAIYEYTELRSPLNAYVPHEYCRFLNHREKVLITVGLRKRIASLKEKMDLILEYLKLKVEVVPSKDEERVLVRSKK